MCDLTEIGFVKLLSSFIDQLYIITLKKVACLIMLSKKVFPLKICSLIKKYCSVVEILQTHKRYLESK